MIQRIQTVFLLLAIVSIGLFLWLPLIGMELPNFHDEMPGWSVGHSVRVSGESYIVFFNAILAGSAAGLALISIFLFKKRSVQMLLCWFSLILLVAAEGFVYYKYYTKVFLGDVILTYWNLLAAGAGLLLILAIVFIRKDENLVKSLDRLR